MFGIYYYILRYDDGVAPCVDDEVLTLAICKPAIRRVAEKGDWILGISPKRQGHKLCYAARVTGKIEGREYYVGTKFRGRGDCIYRFSGTGFRLRQNRLVHTEADAKADVGLHPTYKNAVILRSTRCSFWYFGKYARDIPRSKYPALNRRLDRLNQGHRERHSKKVHEELREILAKLKRETPGVRGPPRDPPKQVSHDAKCSKHHGVC